MREHTTSSDGQVVGKPGVEPLGISPPEPVGNTKADTLYILLSRPNGATVAQIQKRLIWQPHTVRAAISRLRARGLTIELDRTGKVRRYRALPTESGQ